MSTLHFSRPFSPSSPTGFHSRTASSLTLSLSADLAHRFVKLPDQNLVNGTLFGMSGNLRLGTFGMQATAQFMPGQQQMLHLGIGPSATVRRGIGFYRLAAEVGWNNYRFDDLRGTETSLGVIFYAGLRDPEANVEMLGVGVGGAIGFEGSIQLFFNLSVDPLLGLFIL